MESEANREKLILNTERVIASELTKTTLEKKVWYQSAVLWRDQFSILWSQNKQT